MRSPFGRAKQRKEQVEREAQADFEAALARAKPPTEAERTWVLPTPDVPDLGVRPPSRTRPRENVFSRASETREETSSVADAADEPAPARRRAPKAAKRTTATRSTATRSGRRQS